MVFCSKEHALDKKGNLKKGYKEVHTKNGGVRYMKINEESKTKPKEKKTKKIKEEYEPEHKESKKHSMKY
jgi:hypothetical protein